MWLAAHDDRHNTKTINTALFVAIIVIVVLFFGSLLLIKTQ
jgi:hypothetical protein